MGHTKEEEAYEDFKKDLLEEDDYIPTQPDPDLEFLDKVLNEDIDEKT